MRLQNWVIGLLLLAPLSLGCEQEDVGEVDPAAIDVAYRFQGIQPPTRVNLYVIPAEAAPTCRDVGPRPEELALDWQRSLPFEWIFSEGVQFEDLPGDQEWTVVGVGFADAAEVAFGCEDNVVAKAGTVAYPELVLVNEPIPVEGHYTGILELDFGLTGGGFVTDTVFEVIAEAVCRLLETCEEEPDEEERAIVQALLLEFANLEVVSHWTWTQRQDLVRGDIEWTHIQGIEVGPDWKILRGSFRGEIPGTTQMLLSSRDLEIDTLELAQFLLQEVLEEDLEDFPPNLAEGLPRLQLTDGVAEAVDVTFDRRADRIHGAFFTTVGLGGVNLAYGVPLPWSIHRVEGPTPDDT